MSVHKYRCIYADVYMYRFLDMDVVPFSHSMYRPFELCSRYTYVKTTRSTTTERMLAMIPKNRPRKSPLNILSSAKVLALLLGLRNLSLPPSLVLAT